MAVRYPRAPTGPSRTYQNIGATKPSDNFSDKVSIKFPRRGLTNPVPTDLDCTTIVIVLLPRRFVPVRGSGPFEGQLYTVVARERRFKQEKLENPSH